MHYRYLFLAWGLCGSVTPSIFCARRGYLWCLEHHVSHGWIYLITFLLSCVLVYAVVVLMQTVSPTYRMRDILLAQFSTIGVGWIFGLFFSTYLAAWVIVFSAVSGFASVLSFLMWLSLRLEDPVNA